MSYMSSRTFSLASTSTLHHQWDPHQVLDLPGDSRCVGWAPSQGRKCHNVVNWRDISIFNKTLREISSQALDAVALQSELRKLALTGLCKQYHRRSQVEDMVDKWTMMINDAARTAQHRRSNTSSNTASSATAQSFHPALLRSSSSSSSSTISSSTLPGQSEAESLRRSIAAMQATIEAALRRLEHIETPQAPRIEPARSLNRVRTTDISSAHLSTPSSGTSSGSSLRSSSSSISTPSSPTRSTSSRHSATSTSSSDSSTPPGPPTQPLRRLQSTSVRTTDSSGFDSSASNYADQREALIQGLDMLLQDIALSQAPPPNTTLNTSSSHLASTASSLSTPLCTRTHVRRLPVSDDCPICYESMEGGGALSWCKSGCGQSVHLECMDIWKASCLESGTAATCTMCRTAWSSGCEC